MALEAIFLNFSVQDLCMISLMISPAVVRHARTLPERGLWEAVDRARCLHSGSIAYGEAGKDGSGPAGEPGPASTGSPAGQKPSPVQAPQQQQQHWLDKHFPGARQWLEAKNREWWIKGLVMGRCKQYHQLEGRQGTLQSSIEAEYQLLHDRHAACVVDDRSETHLQVACLAMATRKVLLPFLRDEEEVLKIVREHMGEQTSPVLSFLMKAVKFLHRDPFATLSNRLKGLQWDYGRGFASNLQLGQDESSLTISSCFYHSLYSEEGAPQLTACSCCSQDQIWLAAAQYKGVAAGLESSIAWGDRECCFRVCRIAQADAA